MLRVPDPDRPYGCLSTTTSASAAYGHKVSAKAFGAALCGIHFCFGARVSSCAAGLQERYKF